MLSIVLLGKFNVDIFMDNFWGEPAGPGFGEQVVSTMIALVWVFTGIEGAVVISGRAKYVRDVGRSTALGFAAVFTLYLIISMLSLGIMPREEMAQLATPSMAGILERAIGPVGAAIVNLGVILSLVRRDAGLRHHCIRDAVRGGAPRVPSRWRLPRRTRMMPRW